MDIFSDNYSQENRIHHAYILEGEKDAIREKLLNFIEKKLKLEIHANPDIFHQVYETLTIDDARSLREIQSLKALAGDKKIFILELFSITVEAQNSLLKVFEEPTEGTHFFIIAPSAEIFLPTLKSRVIIIRDRNNKENNSHIEAQNFLALSIPDRLKLVADIAEEKNKSQALDLINALIKKLHASKKPDSFDMKELLMARKYISDRSPSLKLLLEHIALIV